MISIFFLGTAAFAVSAKSDNAQGNNGKGSGVANTTQTLTELESKVKNPTARQELQQTIQITEESQATAEGALKDMSGRPGFLKFIIGPDYKNAGEVRSEIVRMRNEIQKLTRTRERVSGTDQTVIDESIASLEENLTELETSLSEALEGVSLFGWLSKLLSGFSAPVATPTSVASPSPSASAIPTATPGV
ncbi:MAG: hypothetical protein ACD_24C00341G0003 [uncultured bacterium]|nr:MAG: hypothetical protein ACD_24C00341G0003 [uncultured bacterium]